MPQHNSHEITRLKCVGIIVRQETLCIQALASVSPSFEQSFLTYQHFINSTRSLQALIKELRAQLNEQRQPETCRLFDRYLGTLESIRRSIEIWMITYLGLCWPDEVSSKKIKRKLTASMKEEWLNQTRNHLCSLREDAALSPTREEHLVRIHELAQQQMSDHHDSPWISRHKQLTRAVYDELLATIHSNQQKLHRCFEKTAYTLSIPDEQSSQQINDWLDGYKKPGTIESTARETAEKSFTTDLRSCERRRLFRACWRNALLGFYAIALVTCVHVSDIDTHVWTFAKTQTLKILSLDPASLNLKQKKDYFHNYILEINDQTTPDELSETLKDFTSRRLYTDPTGMYVFTEQILRAYFLLLSAVELPKDLTSGVINTAGLMDKNVERITREITGMFEGKLIEDSKLRKLVLELRQALVRHNIFPFTFIAVKGNTPYLFMFPEKITERINFTEQHMALLGLDHAFYSRHMRFPLKVFVVKGDRYPFKDRAGYFEGEFAVVFADVAARVEWSAWHEFAHIIDQMRFIHGGRAFPKNMEIHAVLFPAIFSNDAKAYLLNRVLPMVRSKEPRDAYAQAAKGILNGMALYNGLTGPLISDKFLPNEIEAAERLIFSKSNDDIQRTALETFKDPEKYLKTAKAGEYRGIISNAEEIVAGTPRAPYQGFILSGYGKSADENDAGISFIFDEINPDQGFFQGKNIFGIIQEILYFMRYAQRSDIRGFRLMNFIASAIDFILILGFFSIVHKIGSPYRKRKFYGQRMDDIIRKVYKDNPVSDGRSLGERPGEQTLLIQALDSRQPINEDLCIQIRALKKTLTIHQRALMDILLSIAPFNPERSRILSKWHDFLFWLPFAGPAIARSPWFSDRQKFFQDWERFNNALIHLAQSITPTHQLDAVHDQYRAIIKRFRNAQSLTSDPKHKSAIGVLHTIEESLMRRLNELGPDVHLKAPARTHRLPWLSSHDGEFDHLAPYSWHDDVKRIDWKATARSTNQTAKIRKYRGSSSARLEFVIDCRFLNQTAAQEKLVDDLIRSLRFLNHDNELRALNLIMPDGSVRRKTTRIHGGNHRSSIIQQIWTIVGKSYEEHLEDQHAFLASDLTFYTSQENAMYRRVTQLTDFADDRGELKEISKIYTEGTQVYLIGTQDKNRDDILRLLPRTRQPFYWK